MVTRRRAEIVSYVSAKLLRVWRRRGRRDDQDACALDMGSLREVDRSWRSSVC